MHPENLPPAAPTSTENLHRPPLPPAEERAPLDLQYVRDVLAGKITPQPLSVPPLSRNAWIRSACKASRSAKRRANGWPRN
jgi:hypothetical protein